MDNLIIIAVAVLLVLIIVLPYIRNKKKESEKNAELLNQVYEPDESEIGTFKPVIDRDICVGCASCVNACDVGGTLAIVNNKSYLVNPKACESHGNCAKACPTGALQLFEVGQPRMQEVPEFDKQSYESNLKNVFIIGELTGTGLIKNALTDGQLVIEKILSKKDFKRSENAEIFDIAIVGSGPAGLSAGLACIKNELNYVIIEQNDIANTIRNFPRKKLLLSEPVRIPMYGTLWAGDCSKEELIEIWDKTIQISGIKINSHEKLNSLTQENGHFVLETSKANYKANHVLLALGKRGTPRKLGVVGEELSKVTYKLQDAETYKNEKIVVVGAGDSAIEAAVSLANQNTNNVTLVNRNNHFNRAKEKNKNNILSYAESGKIEIFYNSSLNEISENKIKINLEDKVIEKENDSVLIFAGGELPNKFLKSIGVNVVEVPIN
ncbi:MAG: 4Fe-4S dicluster domain-containing protein [Calditrichaeota bacterium]|nr:MAG: 4Fe-4S dicluster domain-containing protein [Calditrichota bacterium]